MLGMADQKVDVKAKLDQLKARAEKAKMDYARAETELESIERQRKQVLDELTAEGVTEADLDQVIDQLDEEIESLIAEAEKLLNPPADQAELEQAS